MGASNPFRCREAAQAFFRTAQAEVGMTDEELVYLFELDPEELARASAGDTTVWEARLDRSLASVPCPCRGEGGVAGASGAGWS